MYKSKKDNTDILIYIQCYELALFASLHSYYRSAYKIPKHKNQSKKSFFLAFTKASALYISYIYSRACLTSLHLTHRLIKSKYIHCRDSYTSLTAFTILTLQYLPYGRYLPYGTYLTVLTLQYLPYGTYLTILTKCTKSR